MECGSGFLLPLSLNAAVSQRARSARPPREEKRWLDAAALHIYADRCVIATTRFISFSVTIVA
jgi:hypothetical protein